MNSQDQRRPHRKGSLITKDTRLGEFSCIDESDRSYDLNLSALSVWELADGRRSVEAISFDLEHAALFEEEPGWVVVHTVPGRNSKSFSNLH